MGYQVREMYYKKELAILEQYENYFKTAIQSGYMRNLTTTQTKEIHRIYERAIGRKYLMCFTCGHSKLKLLQDAGSLYFKQKNIDIK